MEWPIPEGIRADRSWSTRWCSDTLDIVLRSPHLSDVEKEAILGGTAARLLRI
jgi:hypothetical protein